MNDLIIVLQVASNTLSFYNPKNEDDFVGHKMKN